MSTPEWKALEKVHARANAEVLLTSPEYGWNSAAASRFRLGRTDVKLPSLGVPAFGINYALRAHLAEIGLVAATGVDGLKSLY